MSNRSSRLGIRKGKRGSWYKLPERILRHDLKQGSPWKWAPMTKEKEKHVGEIENDKKIKDEVIRLYIVDKFSVEEIKTYYENRFDEIMILETLLKTMWN